MINRYEAYRDGTALSSISDNIIIHDIQYNPPSIQRRTGRVANRNGCRLYGEYFGDGMVTIVFEIREYDTVKRDEICQKVAAWAMYGKYLTVSDRPWKRLMCVCETPPVIQSAKKWTDALKMTFKAYVLPFWEEVNEAVLSLTGTSATGNLYVPGNVKNTLVRVKITAGESVNSVKLTVGTTVFNLKSLSLSSGDIITIDYDDNMILSIKKGSTSMLSKRSGSDDLLADSGKLNTFGLTASGSVTAEFKVRGWSV